MSTVLPKQDHGERAPSTPTRVAHCREEASTLAKPKLGPRLVFAECKQGLCNFWRGELKSGRKGKTRQGPHSKHIGIGHGGHSHEADPRPDAGKPEVRAKKKRAPEESEGRGWGSSGSGGQRSELMTKVLREGPEQSSPGSPRGRAPAARLRGALQLHPQGI